MHFTSCVEGEEDRTHPLSKSFDLLHSFNCFLLFIGNIITNWACMLRNANWSARSSRTTNIFSEVTGIEVVKLFIGSGIGGTHGIISAHTATIGHAATGCRNS